MSPGGVLLSPRCGPPASLFVYHGARHGTAPTQRCRGAHHGGTALAERGSVAIGDSAVHYELVRSANRTRTIQLTIQGGLVRVRAPVREPRERVEALIVARGSWVLDRLDAQANCPAAPDHADGDPLTYLGTPLALVFGTTTGRRVSVELKDGRLHLTVPWMISAEARTRAIRAALDRWLFARAYETLSSRVQHLAGVMGVEPGQVRLGNQRRRWGSCAPDGTLRFNWRIIMAAPELLDYLVVHELAHLRQPNHSPAFWAEVAAVIPEYGDRRSLLRREEWLFDR